jgi:hypothetical protein
MQVFLPGTEVEGTELACGGRLKYKFNGNNLSRSLRPMLVMFLTICSIPVGCLDPVRLCGGHVLVRRGVRGMDFPLG